MNHSKKALLVVMRSGDSEEEHVKALRATQRNINHGLNYLFLDETPYNAQIREFCLQKEIPIGVMNDEDPAIAIRRTLAVHNHGNSHPHIGYITSGQDSCPRTHYLIEELLKDAFDVTITYV